MLGWAVGMFFVNVVRDGKKKFVGEDIVFVVFAFEVGGKKVVKGRIAVDKFPIDDRNIFVVEKFFDKVTVTETDGTVI